MTSFFHHKLAADKGDLDGVLEACLTFSSTSSLTVLFKILACVRLMTNKTGFNHNCMFNLKLFTISSSSSFHVPFHAWLE